MLILKKPQYLLIWIAFIFIHESRAQELDQSLLWRIEGNGLKTSYVFGTFHLLPQRDFELKEKVVKAFKEVDQLVLELNMSDPNLQMNIMMRAMMENGKTLSSLFTKEDYELVDRVLKATSGSGLEDFNTIKPYVLYSMLMPTLLEGQPASFEASLVQMAKEDSIGILGLESVEYQMSIFDKIPYEDQIDNVVDLIRDRERIKALFDNMIAAYKNEEVSNIYTMITQYMRGENELQYLVLDRNRNWIPIIGDLAKEKSTFFGVGAGHIAGDNGLINLLKVAGYTVTPIY